ncbi:hypothetical protein KIN20_009078 [Parelaphostrongylus tenuis]|uniref:Beta-galactosidase n=1 Tax=Parelaphostrongylus tenuis TaxID=148309 RepID=A0AAD5QJC4_PARTN|nr:hypothetical protein KIN20_009078 [Parelaphostrongylus tenuis]
MSSHFHLFKGVLIIFYLNVLSQAISKIGRLNASPSFSIDYQNNQFLLDGEPFRYISGSIHYFRIHQSQWKDRLHRVRALGFNAIQYYIPWNFHEIFEGDYNFAGGRNFSNFSLIAHELGMYSLAPYSCGEWENGGLPWWLLNKNISSMRTSDKRFKNAVQTWFSVLLPLIKPLLRKNNGPVLMVQIENEYGSYDKCDRNYTAWLRDLTREFLGDDTVIYTTDGSGEQYLKCGTVPDTLATVDFGPTSETAINASFTAQKKFLPKGHGPLVNSEFYPGWFLLWGQKSITVPSTATIMRSAQYMYSLGANMNFYMIHGGTNYGFWNGAETNAPCITSYDYFSPISEAGDITEKYIAIRSWIKGIPGWKTRPLDVPRNNTKKAFGVVNLQPISDLSQQINGNCIFSETPMSFEQIGQPFGFVLYTRKMETCGKRLQVKQLKDFGYVYLQQKHLGTLIHSYYDKTKNYVDLEGCVPGDRLIILVENQGRQTTETINDPKGIISDVEMDEMVLNGWTQCKVNIAIDYMDFTSSNVQVAGNHGVYRGFFNVDVPTDTFFVYNRMGKGVAIVNGKNLGRYWASEGPQYTLYVPSVFSSSWREFCNNNRVGAYS